MNIKQFVIKTHLTLGLISGIIVFIVAVTGALYAFKSEIESFTQGFKNVEAQPGKEFISPSEAKKIAAPVFPEKEIHGIVYGERNRALEVVFFESEPLFYRSVFINPYSGEIIKIKNHRRDFFNIVLSGHFNLWLPFKIGMPIISSAILIFVVMLITGLVLWWPGKKSKYKQGFFIRKNAQGKYKLIDLHSVFGFYSNLVLLVLALTGLVWGFQWFSKGVYTITGGTKELAFKYPNSDSTLVNTLSYTDASVDKLWNRVKKEYPEGAEIEVHFPHEDNHEALLIHINTDNKTFWKTDYRYFDKYSLEELSVDNIWGRFENTNKGADKLRRMNYDIHIGSILGLPGKIIVFLASLVAASLPYTGFLMWRNKRNEKKEFLKKMEI